MVNKQRKNVHSVNKLIKSSLYSDNFTVEAK